MNEDLPIMRGSGLQGVAIDNVVQDRPRPRAGMVVAAYPRRAILGVILIAATFLNVFQLSRVGYGDTYYAAGVKSMLMSWHNFFFVSFDPGGFVSIDKPPLGFWIQAASAEIFGLHGWSLILPEALAGVGSVLLVYHLVARIFGDLAGLLAAVFMTVTPVAVATNRSNIVDSLLVFTILLGAWAVFHAVETGRLRWLLLAMALVGLGFNIKMLEAYLALPAFVAVYFLGARLPWRTKIWHLALAGVVLLAISFSWATAVDLTPAGQRPYVGSSDNNSEFNLIFGYNGLGRLLGGNWSFLGLHGRGFGRGPARSAPPQTARNTGARLGFGQGENGAPGPLRLINQQLGGQAGWLLPLALVGILAAGWQLKPRLPLEDRHRSLLFWGVWLLTGAGFFSVANFFHSYYLVMIAPPMAALGGIAIASMWRDFRSGTWRGLLLPFALVGVALVQRRILSDYPNWHPWVSRAILDSAIVVAAALLILWLARFVISHLTRFNPNRWMTRGAVALIAAGTLVISLAPAAWAADTTLYGTGGLLAKAGPAGNGGFGRGLSRFGFGGGRGFDVPGFPPLAGGGGFGAVDPLMLQYLLNNQGTTKFLLATNNANSASPIILATGKPVMALGGFTGSDPILTVADLQRLIANNTVRFFLLDGGFGGRGRGFVPPAFGRGGSTGDFAVPPESGQIGSRSGDASGANGFPQGRRGQPALGVPGGRGFGGTSSESLTQWVVTNCSPVSPSVINGTQNSVTRGANLYDCKP